MIWDDLGVPPERVVRSSWVPAGGFPVTLEVTLPKNVNLLAASRALEALARDSSAGVGISWVREETALRQAEISLDGVLTHRVILREEKEFTAPQLLDGPKVAVIMDDLGGDERVFKLLLDMAIPITMAMLPGNGQARRMAQEAHARGLEIMVHMPMEPRDYPSRNPGPRALKVSMEGQEALKLIASQLDEFPWASGANNHMGSRLTEDPQRMGMVMEMLAARSMYFVDSLTSPRSVGYTLARQRGLKAYRRDVFLDNARSPERILEQFQNLMRLARSRGYGIGICHPYPETVALLPELHKLSTAEGIRWVKVSELPQESSQRGVPLASSRRR